MYPLAVRAIATLFACLAAAAGPAWAQQRPGAPRDSTPPPATGTEQKIERLRHEDAGTRIDELRVGGESRQITVSPKGNAPAYEVPPEGNNRNPTNTDRARSGSGGWKLFGF